MINFELSLKRENDVFRLTMSVGKFLSPHEKIKPQTRPSSVLGQASSTICDNR